MQGKARFHVSGYHRNKLLHQLLASNLTSESLADELDQLLVDLQTLSVIKVELNLTSKSRIDDQTSKSCELFGVNVWKDSAPLFSLSSIKLNPKDFSKF